LGPRATSVALGAPVSATAIGTGAGTRHELGKRISVWRWLRHYPRKTQARVLAAKIGGESKYYSQHGEGWLCNSNGTTQVKFTVPKGGTR
jgi:hypothetical protein